MRSWTLAFLLGILILQQFLFLPDLNWVWGIVVLVILAAIFLQKKISYFSWIIACGLGFAWALWYAHTLLAWSLPQELEGKSAQVTGYIASIPNQIDHRVTFLFSLDSMQAYPTHALLKLSWQNKNILLHAGERWQFIVRLKRIHGLVNPGGFDYEAWAFQEGIRASGYVVNHAENSLLSQHSYHFLLSQLRQHLKEKIEKNLPVSDTSPWIIALALGERQNISATHWEILRNTGTNHLMAIAGLHIGFVASFVFSMISWLWRRSIYLTLKIPAQHVGAIAGLSAAVLYSALAGFSLPTQRACIMLSIVSLIVLMRRKIISWQAWCIALLAALLLNPLSVLIESFWLSFGSVALIIYGIGGRRGPHGLGWKLSRIQWVIALGLIPLSVWLFQQCSLISFVANSIAIPWIGFVVLPLTLLGCIFLCISTTLSGYILLLADQALHLLWGILTYFSHLSWASWYQVVPEKWILFVACIGAIILLLPAGFSGRYLGIIWFFPLIFYRYPMPASGEVWFTLLDVGQGLSAVVQTQTHILVFDAGARFSNDYDMGESVVTPFLRSIGAKKIDLLVVSHGDNDHMGGVKTLLHQFSVSMIKTSVPEKFFSFPVSYCLRGEQWKWDEVNFSFLYPSIDKLDLNNDSSCVLRITTKNQKHILLTGDIERLAEKELIQNDAGNIKADILIAPHHGSKTSALDAFVQDVHPYYVLFPVGYRNRYHLPNKSVEEKYRNVGAKLFFTDKNGAVQLFLTEKNTLVKLCRLKQKHYWSV